MILHLYFMTCRVSMEIMSDEMFAIILCICRTNIYSVQCTQIKSIDGTNVTN